MSGEIMEILPAKLADETGKKITVLHFPPGIDK
jgi:hypothetical protein